MTVQELHQTDGVVPGAPLLEVRDLTVEFRAEGGAVPAVRGMTLSLREREFVLAAKYSGVGTVGIIFRHLIPNMASLLIIDATISVASAIIAESGLSYFGFGVQPPDVSLGTLIAEGTQSAFTFPWLFMFAGSLLVVATLAVSVLGDGLRDALDPGSTRGGGR